MWAGANCALSSEWAILQLPSLANKEKLRTKHILKNRFLGWLNNFCNPPALPHWWSLTATVLEGALHSHSSYCGAPLILRIFGYLSCDTFSVTSSGSQSWHQTDGSFTESSHFFSVHPARIDWARQQDKATAGALTVQDTEAQKGFLIEECIFQRKP